MHIVIIYDGVVKNHEKNILMCTPMDEYLYSSKMNFKFNQPRLSILTTQFLI